MFYVRWKKGEPRRGRVFTEHNSATADLTCLLCRESLGTRPYQLVAMGPDDSDCRVKHDTDRWYAARAMIMHERCVAKKSDAELDQIGDEVTEILMAWWVAPVPQ